MPYFRATPLEIGVEHEKTAFLQKNSLAEQGEKNGIISGKDRVLHCSKQGTCAASSEATVSMRLLSRIKGHP